MGFTTSITIIAPATGQSCQALAPPVTGILWDETNGLPVIGVNVTLKYDSTVIGTDTTGGAGDYSIADAYIPADGPFTLTIDWAGDATYDPTSNTSPITMSYCEGDEDLAAKLWVTRYRTPSQIATEGGVPLWGAILCIDPNGLRTTQKGPIYYLLDTCITRPGLTDKAGGFAATINDNKTSISSIGIQKRPYDMTLFEADTIYIRDNDEFWVGVQQGTVGSGGPVTDNESGLQNSWVAGTGGRYWFMGGWIIKRFYSYDEATRIIANLEGKCYMDLWKENYFGTDDIPRDYTEDAVDILQVIVDVLHDINAAQDTDWEFRSHPENFPGSRLTDDVAFAATRIYVENTDSFSPGSAFIWDNETRTGETVTIVSVTPGVDLALGGFGITTPDGFSVAENAWIVMSSELTGTPFLKSFNNNADFTTLRDLCERADHEWKIAPYPAGTTPAARRALEFYPRSAAPVSSAQFIQYETNIRQLPSIMVGDTTNLVTNALITGKPLTLPEDTWRWINTGIWPDKVTRNRYYSVASTPPPPNAHSDAIADASLILDDQAHPALSIQKDNQGVFDVSLSFYAEGSDIGVATLDADLRKWRRLKFRFRHPTAESASIPLTVTNWALLTGHTIIVTATSVAAEAIPRVYHLVEGIDWTASVDNDTTAESIRSAINALTWTSATRALAVITVTGTVTGFLSYIASTATAGLAINTAESNLYRVFLHTYNPTWKGNVNVWNQAFIYDFGTGAKQSSTTFNDPVASNYDVVVAGIWSEIDILLPEVNPDGTIGDGTIGSLTDDTYMHGWRPVYLSGPPHSPSTTADPTNIDFVGLYIDCKERGPGGTATDAPGAISRSLSGTNKNFVATLTLGAPAAAGDLFIKVTNAERIAGDYAMGVGAAPTEARIFRSPYPEYFIWKNLGNYEPIKIAAIATSGAYYPGTTNVLLQAPLQNNYTIASQLLCRGGWNFCFSQLHFALGSIDKAASLPANLANPKRFRLISSDDVEYLVDVEGLADQALLDATALQAIKLTLDGDPRRRIGLQVTPYLDPDRFAAGLPTTFHGIDTIIDSMEHQVNDVDFVSTLVLGPLDNRVRERLLAMIAGRQELKLKETSYGIRSKGKYQRVGG